MIRKKAIDAFLQRERRDIRTWKSLTDEELQARCNRLPIKPPIWHKLRRHQKICFLIGARRKHFAFFLSTGMGKTVLTIALARYFERLGTLQHLLVLVPNKINKSEWGREIRKHSPNTSYCILTGSSKDKLGQMGRNDALITIETYAGFVRMLCDLLPNRKGMNKLRPNVPLVRAMQKFFNGVALDESTHAKNRETLPYRVCRQLVKRSQMTVALTGTPFGRDPIDLWAQIYLVDKGYTLGETLGLFRAVFFTQRTNYWGGFEYKFRKSRKRLLNTVLANSMIRFKPEEGDLPPVTMITKHVRLPSDATTYYDTARKAIIAAHGNYQEMKNAFLRMRQISSGFLGYRDDERGIRAQYEFTPNPKLELLMSIIQSIDVTKKIIVFHDFIYSGDMIAREFTAAKIAYLRVPVKGMTEDVVLEKFDNSAKHRVLIMSRAGAYGLNLQAAQFGIFYESPVSVIVRKQMEARFERQGSKHQRVFRYDLLTKGTVDESIRAFHREGKDLFSAIVDGKAKL